VGGGICQVSTTLFNAAFFAGLEIVERVNHSIYISHYPKGRDATVSAGSPNFRFRNDTDNYILVRGVSNGVVTTFVIYGTPDGRKTEYETSDFYNVEEMTVITYPSSKLKTTATSVITTGQTGRSVKVTRKVTSKSGEVIHNDTFISTWRMIPREVAVGVTSSSSSTSTTQKTTTASSTTTTTEKPKTTETTQTKSTTTPSS